MDKHFAKIRATMNKASKATQNQDIKHEINLALDSLDVIEARVKEAAEVAETALKRLDDNPDV